MIKRSLIIPLIGAVLVVGAGGTYAVLKLRNDPLREGQASLNKGDIRAASVLLRTAVRDAPDNREAHFALARVQLRSGDAVAAEKELRVAADLGYDKQKITPLLVQSYLDQKKFKELLADFPVTDGAPDAVAPILIARGLAQFSLQDPVAAQASIAKAEELAPNSPDAPFAAARVALAGKDLATADREIDRALTLSPHLAQARLLKAQIALLRGDRSGALDQLSTAVTDSPHYDVLRIERANLLIGNGEDAKAKADVDAVFADSPGNPYAIYLDAILDVRKKDYTAANVQMQKLSTIMSRFPRGLYFDAVVKVNLKQLAQATDSAIRYVAQNPNDLDGLKLLAQIHLSNQRPDLAAEVLTKAVRSGLQDADMLDLLGRSYAAAGKAPDALRTYRQAAELAPRSPDILAHLAATRLGLGDVSGANGDLQKSLALAPDQPDVGETLAFTQLAAGDQAAAAAAIEKLRATQGDSLSVGNLTGLLKLAALDLPGAQAQFEKVLKAYPDAVPVKLNLIKLAFMEGRRADAEAALEALLVQQPTDMEAVVTLVGALLEDKNLPKATEIVEKAHAAAPANPGLVAALANLYLRAKQPQQALKLLDDAATTQGSIAILMGARAAVLTAMGNSKDAIELYRKILAVNVDDTETRTKLVDLLVTGGDYAGAKAVLMEQLRAMPGNASVMSGIVRIDMAAGGISAALASADDLARTPANLPLARLLKGDLYGSLKQYGDAANAYDAELRKDPTPLLESRYAVAVFLAGRMDQALESLRSWFKAHPDDTEVLSTLSNLELIGKRYKEAQAHFEALLQMRPNDGSALNNLAWLYQQANDPRAMNLAERAYLIAHTPDAGDTYGWLLASRGDFDKALVVLRDAAARPPAKGAILYHYAVVLKAKGMRDEAVRALTAATASPGPFDEREAATSLLTELSAKP